MKKRKVLKQYYVCHILDTNELIISLIRKPIADRLGLNTVTLKRHLSNSNVWCNDKFVLWKGVEIAKLKRGFGYRRGNCADLY